MGVSADAAWLTGAAEQLLAGNRMTVAFYDSNPPMCYMIFVPVALLMTLGIPLWTALTVFTFLLAGLSFALLAATLRLWPDLSTERFWGILAAWALGTLLLSRFEFGQKDHFIALTILPFLLLQLARTQGRKIPLYVIWATCLIAVPCLLIKPHYGLLPVLALAQRFWRQRRVSIVFDFDFVALTCGVIFYALATIIWFPDFIIEVVLKSLDFYVSKIDVDVFKNAFGLLLLSGSLLFLSIAASQKDSAGQIGVFIAQMAFAASFVFLLQFKGFSVHILPALGLLIPAGFLSVSLLWSGFFSRSSLSKTAVVISVLILAGYVALPLRTANFTHQDYRDSSLAKVVRLKAGENGFFMQSLSTNVIVPVSLYSGIPIASRFSLMWFLEGISGDCTGMELKACEGKTQIRQYFVDMLVEDLMNKKPGLVAVLAHPTPAEDLLSVMRTSDEFRQVWKDYHKDGQYTLDYREYFQRPELHLDPPRLYDLYVLR